MGSDQTEILRAGYWPSYNVPFHEQVGKDDSCFRLQCQKPLGVVTVLQLRIEIGASIRHFFCFVFVFATFAPKCKVICERDTKSHARHIPFSVRADALTKDSHNTGNIMPCSFRIVCGFFNVPQ